MQGAAPIFIMQAFLILVHPQAFLVACNEFYLLIQATFVFITGRKVLIYMSQNINS